MDDKIIKCAICGKGGKEKLKVFTENIFEKYAQVLEMRAQHGLKYGNITLPSSVTSNTGYHSRCYKDFTAVKRKYLDRGSASPIPAGSILQPQSTDSTIARAENSGERTVQASTSSADDPARPLTEPLSMVSVLLLEESTETSVDSTFAVDEATHTSYDSASTHSAADFHEEISVQNACIFCGQSRLRSKGVAQRLIYAANTEKQSFRNNLLQHATMLNDIQLLDRIKRIHGNKTIPYHITCRTFFHTRHRKFVASQKDQTEWHVNRKYHKMAYDELCTFIVENIINNHKCFLLTFLVQCYNTFVSRNMEENDCDSGSTPITTQFLKEKIIKTFEGQIKVVFLHNHNIAAAIDVNVDEASFEFLKEVDYIRQAALSLRHTIFNIKKTPLPERPTAQDLIKGECEVPENLKEFLKTLIGGLTTRRRDSEVCARKVQSFAQDLIYAVRHGRVKTSKHISLGMTMKSITSCRKVVDVLNRYGHCCSYNAVEELETEATFASINQSNICPEEITLSSHFSTGVAFDNFDRFVETSSGKDTLHDTVGIIFQKHCNYAATGIDTSVETLNDDAMSGTASTSGTRKRRSFQTITPELVPYPKKPKMSEVLLPNVHALRQFIPENLNCVKELDLLYMMSHAFNVSNTPMWVGFNSKILSDNTDKQKVTYLTPINVSPTQSSVVIETLKQAQKVAEECRQQYIEVTYDLAIAKVALQIQASERPQFDNVFIHLGSFHIMMAYFKAVGKFIDECGLAYIMVESELLASGSVGGFISGKHFNRCKRLHPLVALGTEILHFRQFLQHEGFEIDEAVVTEVENIQSKKVSTATSPMDDNGALANLLRRYESYKNQTLQGAHGKTAKFYMMYVQFIEYYLILTRSIRTGDFNLFKFILPKIGNLFFVMNQPNYARWLLKYLDNLLRVAETHPGLELNFKEGSFGVKRTEKPFSKQPIDLTLEQTINADAARRLTGVIHFTNSISARQRWARSHSIRSLIIRHVFEEAGLQKAQDVTADLEPRNIHKSIESLRNFTETVKNVMNPFDSGLDKQVLYNIATGGGASEDISNFLLTVEEVGSQQSERFITECVGDESRFEKAIRRNNILNFSASSARKAITVASKVQEVRMQRDLFGRMLALSLEENIDVPKILSYPLTPVPMSLCHIDGTMCKTDKSALMKILEKKIVTQPPKSVDVLIVDGFFILHLMKEVPKTFGAISKKILQMITNTSASRVDITFDTYMTPSIKDNEHMRRERTAQRSYSITGPDQVRPADFAKELRNTNFKEAIVHFLVNHWRSCEIIPFIRTKTVHLNFDKCYRFKVVNGSVEKTEVPSLSCEEHEEADTKIVYHVCNITDDGEVVIRCSDTDILVILLGNMEHLLSPSLKIWMDVGTGNNQRYIDVTSLYHELGGALSKAIPGFHAITGCDYNPAFFKKGKTRPFTVLLKNPEYQEAFGKLSKSSLSENERERIFSVLEEFICRMYSMSRCNTVNDARYDIFTRAYQIKDLNEPFSKKYKNFDATNLPPCEAELHQQLLRTQYIGTLWSHAYLQIPTLLRPQDHGWVEQDGKLELLWFEGDQSPPLVNDVIIQRTPTGEDINETDDEFDMNEPVNEDDYASEDY